MNRELIDLVPEGALALLGGFIAGLTDSAKKSEDEEVLGDVKERADKLSKELNALTWAARDAYTLAHSRHFDLTRHSEQPPAARVDQLLDEQGRRPDVPGEGER